MQTRKQNAGFRFFPGHFHSKAKSAMSSKLTEGGETITSRSRKQMIGGLIFLIAAAFALTSVVTMPAPGPKLGRNWRVYAIMPGTAQLWSITNPHASEGGILQFTIPQFLSTASGSFVVYLYNNYNYDLTGSTLDAPLMWTSGTYLTRGAASDGAYVRFEFQDVTSGPYTANDYWWSTGSTADNCSGTNIDLNGCTGSSGELNASLEDRSLWSNICGQKADDHTAYTGPDCVGGSFPGVSPYDGFTRAMKKVKQLGLSFGRASRYASGVARQDGPGIFYVNGFTVTPPATP